jgi:glucose-1-phosphate thymidylyltransferase
MKGIVLAGGTGSRLWPLTLHVSKQLLPIYDKPLIYYPISTLMLAGIREILIITRPEETELFRRLLGNGKQWGISIVYEQQIKPKGLAESFIIGEKFIDEDEVCLILGDNIFFGSGLGHQLSAIRSIQGAHIFGYQVSNPQDYGVISFDELGHVSEIVEKPKKYVSNIAVPGLYFYSNDVCKIAKEITPSERGELEITAINNAYADKNRISYTELGRGTFWMDTGNFESLLSASQFVAVVQQRQGITIGSPEEVALNNCWISLKDYQDMIEIYANSSYLRRKLL